MKTLYISIIFCLIFGAFTPAWASVELNAYLSISGEPVKPQFKFSKLVTITYPLEGKLKSLLYGQNKTVSFIQESGTNSGVKRLMEDINAQLANETQALTTITNLEVDYQTRVTGGPDHADIEYSVTLNPTLTNYVLNQGLDNTIILDASWMAFDEKNPVIITTQGYGDLEINYLIDFIKSQLPDVYYIIKGTDAETALQQNLIDSAPLLGTYPLDRWDSLFDPAYTLTQYAPSEQVGSKIAVTTFASDVTNFGVNRSTRIGGAEFGTDSDYHLDITEQRNVGTVNVQGHANPYNTQGKWAFSTILMPVITSTGGPVPWYEQVNGWIWIGIVSVAVIVFWIFYLRRFRR